MNLTKPGEKRSADWRTYVAASVGCICYLSRCGKHFPLNPVCIYNWRSTFSHQIGCFSHIRLIVKFYICQHSWLGNISQLCVE